LGARIIILFQDDIDATEDIVLRYFAKAEQIAKEPESDWAFGYFGVHFLLPTPIEVLPPDVDPDNAPRLFELQVRTLFQHAWAETNHDLGYKPDTPLSSEQTRKLAFTSAQSWGADKMFNELHKARPRTA
jgi:putative GTP pyrophosphokinase